jgi:hypothetical protein
MYAPRHGQSQPRALLDLRQPQRDTELRGNGDGLVEDFGNPGRVLGEQRFGIDEAAHRPVALGQRVFAEVVREVLHLHLVDAGAVREAHEVLRHAVEARADADRFVGGGVGGVERHAEMPEPARDALLGAPPGKRGEVGVGRHLDAARRGEANHVDEARMQERLAHALELQLAHAGKLLEQPAERLERHEAGGRSEPSFARPPSSPR